MLSFLYGYSKEGKEFKPEIHDSYKKLVEMKGILKDKLKMELIAKTGLSIWDYEKLGFHLCNLKMVNFVIVIKGGDDDGSGSINDDSSDSNNDDNSSSKGKNEPIKLCVKPIDHDLSCYGYDDMMIERNLLVTQFCSPVEVFLGPRNGPLLVHSDHAYKFALMALGVIDHPPNIIQSTHEHIVKKEKGSEPTTVPTTVIDSGLVELLQHHLKNRTSTMNRNELLELASHLYCYLVVTHDSDNNVMNCLGEIYFRNTSKELWETFRSMTQASDEFNKSCMEFSLIQAKNKGN